MKLNLQITYSDKAEKAIEAGTPDLVAFENKFDVSVAQLGRDTRISWLLFLAWHAEKRNGATKDTYEKWLETVENLGETEQDPK